MDKEDLYISGVIMTSCYWDLWGIMRESAAHNLYGKMCFKRSIKECELLSPFNPYPGNVENMVSS